MASQGGVGRVQPERAERESWQSLFAGVGRDASQVGVQTAKLGASLLLRLAEKLDAFVGDLATEIEAHRREEEAGQGKETP